MQQSYAEFSNLKVLRVSHDGRRRYDPAAKQKLIEACFEPGVSIAGLALAHGVNANLLRTWVSKHRRKRMPEETLEAKPDATTFMEVVEISRAKPLDDIGLLPALPAPAPSTPAPSRLTAQMLNGVTISLECGGHDATLVSAMIEALGRCNVPSGR